MCNILITLNGGNLKQSNHPIGKLKILWPFGKNYKTLMLVKNRLWCCWIYSSRRYHSIKFITSFQIDGFFRLEKSLPKDTKSPSVSLCEALFLEDEKLRLKPIADAQPWEVNDSADEVLKNNISVRRRAGWAYNDSGSWTKWHGALCWRWNCRSRYQR